MTGLLYQRLMRGTTPGRGLVRAATRRGQLLVMGQVRSAVLADIEVQMRRLAAFVAEILQPRVTHHSQVFV